MVTDLTLVSDLELGKIELAIKQRTQKLATKEGKAESQLWAVRMIDYIMASGYKLPPVDKEVMAKAYADQLADAIAVYGYDDIAKVVKEWIKNDDREYKRFPTAGDILAEVKNTLGNPLAEVARRNHEAEVMRIVEHERSELMKNVTDEQMERLERKYKHE